MTINRNDLNALATSWNAAGLGPTPIDDTLAEASQQLDRLAEQLRTLKSDAGAARSHVLDRLATGDLTLLDAAIAEHATGPDQTERITTLHRAAVDRVARRAHAALTDYGDRFITDHLGPAAAKLNALALELGPLVETIDDDQAAIAAPTKQRDAWGKLADVLRRRSELSTVRQTLGRRKIVPALPAWVASEYANLRHPHLKPTGPHYANLHPVRRFVALVEAGTEPGIYTVAEAEAHQQADIAKGLHVVSPDEARAAKRRARRPQVVDLPNVPATFGTGEPEPDEIDPSKLAAAVPRAGT